MKRTLIKPNLADFPEELHPLLRQYPIYDSSCSQAARVYFLDGAGGLYLKTSAAGTLKTEAAMTRYFYGKGLGAEVLDYRTEQRDWLLTRAVPGEDCTFPAYLENPERLCDTLALLLRQLHETSFDGCPVQNRCEAYRETARKAHDRGFCDLSLFPEKGWGFSTVEEAWKIVEENGRCLQNDTLLHGDYCLPNILLDNWAFSAFIDVGKGGVGDRHIDLFWGVWTLFFNLKTNRYYDRFLDAYGRDRVEPELLRTVAAFEVFG
ncbi:MAG: aminoglycoside 3'-phosphotransferase [Oscillospiraceae bacterium]|nr:aminoglycoside 3'-phosphotransferase [Oscillospiraceae bacterium]